MGIPITRTIGQLVGGNWQPTTGLTTVKLRIAPYSTTTYTMNADLGDGVYKFNDVAPGDYKTYVGDVEQTYFGILRVGVLYASDLPSGIDATKIADGTVTNTEFQYLDATSSIQTQLNSKVRLTGATQEISALTIATSQHFQADSGLPTPSGYEYTTANALNEAIGAIVVTPYQQASKVRRIIANGTLQGNQVYTSLGSCTTAISDNAIANRYRVFMQQGQNLASHYDNLFYVLTSNFKNYVDVIGDGFCTNLVIDGSTTFTATCNIENVTIFLGVNNITGARTLNSLTLNNVTIYAYNDITFTNCQMNNVNVYQPISKTVTLSGTTSWTGGGCTNVRTGSSSGIVTAQSELNTSYTMPFDPSLN